MACMSSSDVFTWSMLDLAWYSTAGKHASKSNSDTAFAVTEAMCFAPSACLASVDLAGSHIALHCSYKHEPV